MKKFMGLSTLLLGGALFLTGCSCGGDTGVYKFESFEYTLLGETKTIACSASDKEDEMVAQMCTYFESAQIELKDDGVAVMSNGDEAAQEGQYKVEDGKLFVRNNSEEEWEEYGTIDNGTIVMEEEFMGEMKITFKK